eukprot:CAMPEP_0113454788 /NCGR_PEP_ID=MMETSP0014_2-20120614/8044_1 /TAXON_ID=2857 /ORGANISM="Nitzschia sp." /LENGTH=388 /DNA_ID=CAMNT_0000346205 /DNA_START=96 /DNA_END=1262 /DNA_ORIENTATION=- /assembly_acc=CAM_ASM_000159
MRTASVVKDVGASPAAGTTRTRTVVSFKLFFHLIFSCAIFLLLPYQSNAWTQSSLSGSSPVHQLSPLSSSSSIRLLATKESNDNNNAASTNNENNKSKTGKKESGDNSAMAFLRKIGKVGGPPIDFTNAVGADEGSGGKSSGGTPIGTDHHHHDHSTGGMRKSKAAYKSCVDSGVIDDMSETFPTTSSGTQWAGITDDVMGGKSSGTLTRETDFDGCEGRPCNVLRAKVRLSGGKRTTTTSSSNNINNNSSSNDGNKLQIGSGFVQMATDLALDPSVSDTVDASRYEGLELDLCYHDGDAERQSFNVHLRNSNCLRQFSSYRVSFELMKGKWTTIRLPWNLFQGFGSGAVEKPFDPSSLRRIGIVAIGKAMDVTLVCSSVKFLTTSDD